LDSNVYHLAIYMEAGVSGATSNTSVLEVSRLNYRDLGLIRNPFESIPVFAESEPVPFNNYLKHHVRRLYSLISNSSPDGPATVYLVGPSGCGKSAILRTFSRVYDQKKLMLPIYTRFPLAGGIMAFCSELFRRLPIPLLEMIFSSVREDQKKRTSYIGWKLFVAGMSGELWKSRENIKLSALYAIESIRDLFSIILDITGTKKIALILDEFEHAWARFTGPQKYNWERTIARLFLQLESKVILVLPALPELMRLGERPYMNMYNWENIDMDRILRATNDNVLRVECQQSSLTKCIHSIMHREILDRRGQTLCETVLSTLGSYTTIGEAILDLHDRILVMAQKCTS